jgi:hypothetical protein
VLLECGLRGRFWAKAVNLGGDAAHLPDEPFLGTWRVDREALGGVGGVVWFARIGRELGQILDFGAMARLASRCLRVDIKDTFDLKVAGWW